MTLNGMTSEPITEEHREVFDRLKKMVHGYDFKIILTTNPLAPNPKVVDDIIRMPVIAEIAPKEADFLLTMGKLINDVDGDYGLHCLKARTPAVKDWEVREDGREVLTGRDVVLAFIPGEDVQGRTFINFWDDYDAEQTEN
ncbi:hypothetical protein LRU95_002349 [Salmonella enterica]|nr:hypothetical protein [Salmonella enterica]